MFKNVLTIAVVLTIGLAMAVPASAQIVTSGLIGAHDAGAGWDGTNWADQVTGDGYDPTGTIVLSGGGGSSITHTAASGGNPAYFSFGHEDDFIAMDVMPTVLGTGDFTVQMWLNVASAVSDANHNGLLGDALGGGSNWGFSLGQGRSVNGGYLYAWALHDDEGPPVGPEPWEGWQAVLTPNQEGGIMDGTWHLLTVTRTAVGVELDSGMEIWADDTEITVWMDPPETYGLADLSLATVTLDVNGGFTRSGSTDKVGRLKDGDKVGMVLVYNRALTPAEIAQNFNAGLTVGPPTPGDADGDGDVDDADAAILASFWQLPASGRSNGDFNGDGVANELDATIMAANWTGSLAAAGAVPEPGTISLLLSLGVLGLAMRRRRATAFV